MDMKIEMTVMELTQLDIVLTSSYFRLETLIKERKKKYSSNGILVKYPEEDLEALIKVINNVRDRLGMRHIGELSAEVCSTASKAVGT